jgi:hypothetical protein
VGEEYNPMIAKKAQKIWQNDEVSSPGFACSSKKSGR